MGDCMTRTEFDEIVCVACGLRWGRDEDQPPCPRVQEEGLVDRILDALDLTVSKASQRLKVPKKDIEALLGKNVSELGDMEYDEVWRALTALVDYRLGRLLAARDDMQVKLQKDRIKRAQRREAIEKR